MLVGGGISVGSRQGGGNCFKKAASSCCEGLEERQMRSDRTKQRQRNEQNRAPVRGLLTTCSRWEGQWTAPQTRNTDHASFWKELARRKYPFLSHLPKCFYSAES